jgi:hypothetical protein
MAVRAHRAKVLASIEYTPVLPIELREEYRALPERETLELFYDIISESKIKTFVTSRIIQVLLDRGIVCESIKMLNLEICLL